MKSIVVANWKMNPKTFKEARKILEATKRASEKARSVSLIVAPPALYLRELSAGSRSKRIAFALQDVHYESAGAYTGGISAVEARDSGASYVLIGHSERRAAGESNEDTGKKVAAALSARLTPILCIGEQSRSRSGEHFNFVQDQIRAGFGNISAAQASRVIVAYEPVWAIGHESGMTPRDMQEMSILVRKRIVDLHGAAGHKIKIIYGGAVTEKNAPAMLEHGDVKGLLVGHVSIDPERFTQLLESIS